MKRNTQFKSKLNVKSKDEPLDIFLMIVTADKKYLIQVK
jgi:hypothetical protein